MFCGGSIFNRMDGNARDMVDEIKANVMSKFDLL
jgi:hypothetical protein